MSDNLIPGRLDNMAPAGADRDACSVILEAFFSHSQKNLQYWSRNNPPVDPQINTDWPLSNSATPVLSQLTGLLKIFPASFRHENSADARENFGPFGETVPHIVYQKNTFGLSLQFFKLVLMFDNLPSNQICSGANIHIWPHFVLRCRNFGKLVTWLP